MKKFLALLLSALFAVTPLLGCDTEPPKTDLPPLYAGEEPQRPEYIINPFMIPDVYLTLFKDNGSFELDGAEIRINDYRFSSNDMPIDSEYVIFYTLDMDGDGEYELILDNRLNSDILLLHEDGGKIKGYRFSGDEMSAIYLNGNFGRYGDNLYSVVRLKFTEDGIEYVELARHEGVFEGEYKYFIGGNEVTEDEYEDYAYSVPYAVHYPLNDYLESLGADLESLIDIFTGRESPDCFYNFINENEGYFFWFQSSKLKFVLKTEDGGKSWKYEELWNVPDISWHENIICAKMINEDVGLISSQYRADSNFSNRTYITVNGGKAWEQVVFTPDEYYAEGDSTENNTYNELEAYDLRYEDGEWIICCRGSVFTYEIGKVYVEYSSPGLKNWTYCEKSRISTESFKDYSDIIGAMTALLDGKAKEDFDIADNVYDKEILDALDHSRSTWSNHPLCYAEKDIDGDGTRELLILDKRGTLLSLFTMTEKGPRAVCGNLVSLGTGTYPVCIIGNDGKLYLSSYGRGGTSHYKVCTISLNGDHLDIEYGLTVYNYDVNGRDLTYYGFSNNMMYDITREEYNRLYSEYGFGEIFNSSTDNYDNIERLDLEISYFPGMTPQGK